MNKITTTYRDDIRFDDKTGGSFLIEIYPNGTVSASQTGGHFSFSIDKWKPEKIESLANHLLKLQQEMKGRIMVDFPTNVVEDQSN